MDSFCIHFFFSAKIIAYVVFNDQSFNDMLTNDIVSFEQLGMNKLSGEATPSNITDFAKESTL